MIQHRLVRKPARDWQQSLADVVTNPNDLLELLQLEPGQVGLYSLDSVSFPFRVPREFVARMQPGNPRDPLLLQVLPSKQELLAMPGYSHDPLQEQQVNKLPGLIHKYRGRVLLTITGSCAINCRYCFRQNFSYEQNNPGRFGWQKIIDYVAADPTINEVIFSGGDPLVAKDNLLLQIIEPFSKLPHIKRLRIHTRLPIVIPQRITSSLINVLINSGLQIVVVVHANHPNEIDFSVGESLRSMQIAGITVLNQSVLLKNVNDNAQVLADLCERLFENGCLPYYLHALDKVAGSAHFDVHSTRAKKIVWELSQLLPGYLVPRLVREVPGVGAKVPIDLKVN